MAVSCAKDTALLTNKEIEMDTRTVITQNLVYLEERITNLPKMLSHLIQMNIISQNEREEIEAKVTTQAKNSKLLGILQRKDLPINTFIEILRATNNQHCVNKIQGLPNSTSTITLEDGHSGENKSAIRKSVITRSSALKIIKNIWWPDKKRIIKSLHERKIGQKLLVEELHERISAAENRMVVICESVDASKLTGMGGVGKTLTATWYAHHYEKEYDHVIWIDSGEESLLTSFETLARDLDIKNRKEFLKVEEFARKCYEALEEFKCLWIFDNAENYKGDGGIKEVLPKYKNYFYCLITSRWRNWGTENVGYGNISRLELNIFGEAESFQFLKTHLKKEIQYTDYEIKELSSLLGNLPLALQLAVTTLNNGQMNLGNYIEASSSEDLRNIIDETFDDYEKTINGNIKISLQLIAKEKYGKVAGDILAIMGYIRPDKIQSKFFMKIMKVDLNILKEAIDLLEKYSLVSKTGTVQEILYDDGVLDKIFGRKKENVEMDLLSIHRLLQQVIRHNGKATERKSLRKILGCKGFLDYKLLPFTKYADERLRNEFPKVKTQLVDQQQLKKLLRENRFEESVLLSRIIDQEINSSTTKFNYAICLEMNGLFEDEIKVLEELYKQQIKEEVDNDDDLEKVLLNLETEVGKNLVGGHLLISLWKMGNTVRPKEIMKERKLFKVIHLQKSETLLRIVSSNQMQSNYTFTLTYARSMLKIVLDGDVKKIELLNYPHFVDLSMLSVENINLFKCSLSLDSANRISPRNLKLENVSFVENGRELVAKVNVHDFITFSNMNRLELLCDSYKKNVSIDLSKESANMEYLHLKYVTVLSLKSADGKVSIKEAEIECCLLDLSVLPPSLEKLSLSWYTKVIVSGGIDLPNLKYLQLDDMSHFFHFRSFQLTYLHLNGVEEIDVDILPRSIKTIRIDNRYTTIRFLGGEFHLDNLILYYFPLVEVEEMLPHFNPKKVAMYHYSSYKPVDLMKLVDKQIPIIAIGPVEWEEDDFKNSLTSKQVDRQSEYYLFHGGTGKAIEHKDFEELHLMKDICKP